MGIAIYILYPNIKQDYFETKGLCCVAFHNGTSGADASLSKPAFERNFSGSEACPAIVLTSIGIFLHSKASLEFSGVEG